jgi:hypothetical protein
LSTSHARDRLSANAGPADRAATSTGTAARSPGSRKVRRDLERIFTFRQHAILEQLNVAARSPVAVSIERI